MLAAIFYHIYIFDIPKKKVNFWNQIFENSREYGNFENFEILKCFIYGWMGWMGWMGWGIKSVLKKSSYFVCI